MQGPTEGGSDGACPVETAGVVKMWKRKSTFPHFHSALENSSRKKRGPSFPQFPQGLPPGPWQVSNRCLARLSAHRRHEIATWQLRNFDVGGTNDMHANKGAYESAGSNLEGAPSEVKKGSDARSVS